MPIETLAQAKERLSRVQLMVWQAAHMTADDEAEIRKTLLKQRRAAYLDELNRMAAKVGCGEQRARLTTGAELSALNELSELDAKSIVNTYNRELAHAMERWGRANPRANRFSYAKGFREWDERRSAWKQRQIAMYTDGTARTLAQQDFHDRNALTGAAHVEPSSFECMDCGVFIKAGEVPVEVARRTNFPLHPNCPHGWVVEPDRVPKSLCGELWLGT